MKPSSNAPGAVAGTTRLLPASLGCRMTEAAGLGAHGPRDGDDDVIEALAPVAILIGLGYVLRASGFMPEAAGSPVDRLVY